MSCAVSVGSVRSVFPKIKGRSAEASHRMMGLKEQEC